MISCFYVYTILTISSVWPLNLWTNLPVDSSYKITVESNEPVRILDPSESNANVDKSYVCPYNVCNGLVDYLMSHILHCLWPDKVAK